MASPSVFAKRILDEVITTVGGETKVNWELYAQKMQNLRVDEVEREVNRELLDRGILCFPADTKACFMVTTDSGIPLGPRVETTNLCFVELKDAQAYQQARFAKTVYKVEIYEVTLRSPKEAAA